jgi:hypothetical protein
MIRKETMQPCEINGQRMSMGDSVYVRMEQWVPAGDEQGDWKDTGQGFPGLLMNGPQSRLKDPENGDYWYVLPPERVGVCGNLHPIQISEQAVDPYENEERAGRELIRFVVEAIRQGVEQRV